MILYRRKSDKKANLAKKSIKECKRDSTCPSCGKTLRLAEQEQDRDMFVCESCSSTVTFTKAPNENVNKVPDKKFSSFTLRDKTKNNPNKKSAVVKKENAAQSEIPASLETLRAAMNEKYIISFEYTDSSGNKSVRTAEPYKLTKQNGELVLFAFDLDGSGIRMFKISKMISIEKQSFGFMPRWDTEDKLLEKKDSGSK